MNIVNGLKSSGVAEPVAVCDVYRPRLEAASKRTGGSKMYMHHEDLLADENVDVVCIAFVVWVATGLYMWWLLPATRR